MKLKKNGTSYEIIAENEGSISKFEFEKVMIASGRKANVEGFLALIG